MIETVGIGSESNWFTKHGVCEDDAVMIIKCENETEIDRGI